MEQNIKEEKKDSKKCDCDCVCGHGHVHRCRKWAHTSGGGVYGLGFLGALIYYFQHAANFQAGLFGLLKAIVWPAVFVYKAIELWKI
ncbi:MAG: hypothetical protein M1586_01885 [Patescibacteria group bacterium]|nr:hypothetical protein [Patescibacteria group bacterium]MCL5262033.1 hypothetical protein [Patescibacteria group bacterium]